MNTTGVMRRALYGVFATCVVGGGAAIVAAVPSATAASDPCAASEIARTIGSVATNTGNYLDAHPDTNAALSLAAQQQQGPQAIAAIKTYFDAHPQASKDLQTIQQPLTGLSGRCKLPITLPQLLQLVQGAQQGLPAAGGPLATGPLPGPALTPAAR
jgi:heme-binding protein